MSRYSELEGSYSEIKTQLDTFRAETKRLLTTLSMDAAMSTLKGENVLAVATVVTANRQFGGTGTTAPEAFESFRALFADPNSAGSQWASFHCSTDIQALLTPARLTLADSAIIGARNSDAHPERDLGSLLESVLQLDNAHSIRNATTVTTDPSIPRQMLAIAIMTLIKNHDNKLDAVRRRLIAVHHDTQGSYPTAGQWAFVEDSFGIQGFP
ncbi:hypothetical protein Q8F55_001927 [Vanrija albida]|uniref:Uncharacterized protein n=1 Tax=Vanrija albida TaxID=181172 RepID=A0ABR3Q8C2_9TREE